jgi:hypothetical protein
VITAGLLRAAGVMVTGVDIDEVDTGLTTGPRRGRDTTQATARIDFTAAGTQATVTRLSRRRSGESGRPVRRAQ